MFTFRCSFMEIKCPTFAILNIIAMIEDLRKLIAKELRKVADRIDAGTSEVSETQVMDVMSMLTHEVMSKEVACNFLNLSRSRFDDYVRLGVIPKGKPCKGFKELIWYEDELNDAILKLNR